MIRDPWERTKLKARATALVRDTARAKRSNMLKARAKALVRDADRILRNRIPDDPVADAMRTVVPKINIPGWDIQPLLRRVDSEATGICIVRSNRPGKPARIVAVARRGEVRIYTVGGTILSRGGSVRMAIARIVKERRLRDLKRGATRL
jgi:hypothetical protein